MSYKDRNTALRQPLADNGWFGLGVENWQTSSNASGVDLSGTSPKARVSFIDSGGEVLEIGSNNTESLSGIMQIDLYYPVSEGDAAIYEKADEIKTVYKPQRLPLVNGTSVVIEITSINTLPAEESGWFNLFIEVNFRSYYCN